MTASGVECFKYLRSVFSRNGGFVKVVKHMGLSAVGSSGEQHQVFCVIIGETNYVVRFSVLMAKYN